MENRLLISLRRRVWLRNTMERVLDQSGEWVQKDIESILNFDFQKLHSCIGSKKLNYVVLLFALSLNITLGTYYSKPQAADYKVGDIFIEDVTQTRTSGTTNIKETLH